MRVARFALARAFRGRAAGGAPLGFLGALILIAAVETTFAWFSPRFTVDISASWRWSAKSASQDARKADVLCLGDSLVKFGVLPALIEEEAGVRACNLALFQGHFPAHYFLLKRALDSGASPRALVIDGEMLYADPLEHPWVWAELASPLEGVELAWASGRPKFFAAFLAAWALPSVRARGEIRASVVSLVKGVSSQTGLFYSVNWRNWTRNQGALVFPARCHATEVELQALAASPAKWMTWSCEPTNAVYLRKLLDLAEARGIPVVWLIPPQHPAFVDYFNLPNYAGVRDGFIRDLVARYPQLAVVDGRRSGYEPATLADLVHLNRRGATAFSAELGRILRARLVAGSWAEPRWMTLPGFREPTDRGIEDSDQSLMAIRQEAQTTRR